MNKNRKQYNFKVYKFKCENDEWYEQIIIIIENLQTKFVIFLLKL